MTTSFTINDLALRDEALTHRSFLNENKTAISHNERLEFLGDAVLELIVSEFLYQKFPDQPEGDLTSYRAALVRTTTLAAVATKLGLGEALKMSKGEESSGGRTNTSLLANAFEAILGAMYLDQGYSAVKDFLEKNLFPLIDTIITQKLFKDYKRTLQENVQAKGFASPEYIVVSESGPDHHKEFTVGVIINGQEIARGTGKSKQIAQQEAARLALEKPINY
jgi:ribonuclease III